MKNFYFPTKEEYLQYRKEWKAKYKELSQTIREYKWMQKEYSRMWNKAWIAHGDPFTLLWDDTRVNPRFWDYLHLMENENEKYRVIRKRYIQGKKWIGYYQENATAMLEELKIAKVEAQRQYLESRVQLQLA